MLPATAPRNNSNRQGRVASRTPRAPCRASKYEEMAVAAGPSPPSRTKPAESAYCAVIWLIAFSTGKRTKRKLKPEPAVKAKFGINAVSPERKNHAMAEPARYKGI